MCLQTIKSLSAKNKILNYLRDSVADFHQNAEETWAVEK